MGRSPPLQENIIKINSINRRPRKADFKTINREQAMALVSEFGDLCGLEILRIDGNFTQLRTLQVRHFDNFDLAKAIQLSIDFLSCRFSGMQNPDGKRQLLQRLERACGPLDKSIILTVGIGYPLHFTPMMAS